jgi:hypothetical protein
LQRIASEKLQKIRGNIENVGAPTFLGGVYPPVFAYVWERKELLTRCVHVGETLGLGRKWKIENGKWGPPSREGVASAGLLGVMENEPIRIWERVWVEGLGRRRRVNAQKDI